MYLLTCGSFPSSIFILFSFAATFSLISLYTEYFLFRPNPEFSFSFLFSSNSYLPRLLHCLLGWNFQLFSSISLEKTTKLHFTYLLVGFFQENQVINFFLLSIKDKNVICLCWAMSFLVDFVLNVGVPGWIIY